MISSHSNRINRCPHFVPSSHLFREFPPPSSQIWGCYGHLEIGPQSEAPFWRFSGSLSHSKSIFRNLLDTLELIKPQIVYQPIGSRANCNRATPRFSIHARASCWQFPAPFPVDLGGENIQKTMQRSLISSSGTAGAPSDFFRTFGIENSEISETILGRLEGQNVSKDVGNEL